MALKTDFILMSSHCGSRLTPATNWSRVDQIVKELEIVEQAVDPKDVDIVILSGLTPPVRRQGPHATKFLRLTISVMDRTSDHEPVYPPADRGVRSREQGDV